MQCTLLDPGERELPSWRCDEWLLTSARGDKWKAVKLRVYGQRDVPSIVGVFVRECQRPIGPPVADLRNALRKVRPEESQAPVVAAFPACCCTELHCACSCETSDSTRSASITRGSAAFAYDAALAMYVYFSCFKASQVER